MPGERCSWCGHAVEAGDGYRLEGGPGERRATFCRLEHVVPWFLRGPRWEARGSGAGSGAAGERAEACALCGSQLGEVRLLLVRHRGEHRIADGFCSLEHLDTWAKRGGRWR